MKKSNLAILLLAPFVIAFLGVVSVSAVFSTLDQDIEGIEWDYKDREAFKISDSGYLLKANPVYSSSRPLAYGNELVWTLDEEGEEYASLEKKESGYYLYAKKEGTFSLTCQNKKGNVQRTRQAVSYDKAAILFLPDIPSSQNNLDSTIYYGEYDLDKDLNKVKASFYYQTRVVPENLSSTLRISSISDNISYDVSSGKRRVKEAGEAYLTMSCGYSSEDSKESTLSFTVVDNGVNVYDYKQLRACTNDSKDGETIVLRKNFECLSNTYQRDSNGKVVYKDQSPVYKSENTTLFGYYDDKGSISFDTYAFTRDDSHEFVDKWNENAKSDSSLKPREDTRIAALHVQKSLFGNGYKRNFHDLVYPSKTKSITSGGNTIERPSLGNNDLYRGPSYSYALGDPKNRPLIAVYGQDNCGVYIDTDDVVIDDADIKNCNIPSSLSFLKTCGSVRDIEGDHVSVLYSRLSGGKNVLRAFQSQDTLVQNCLLSNARNFLIDIGTNDYIKIDGSKVSSFLNRDSSSSAMTLDSYLIGKGDDLRGSSYFSGSSGDNAQLKKCLDSLWDGRRQIDSVKDVYKGSMTIDSCYFYRSGIASIGIESVFDGPFRYNNTPSAVKSFRDLFSGRQTSGGSRIPFIPKDRFGISYPVEIKIQGNTRFYDYKQVSQRDITGLIEENFSSLISSLPESLREQIYKIFGRTSSPDKDISISIDDFFPIKPAIEQRAQAQGCYYKGTLEGSEEEGSYRNLPIAYYGGGVNLSKVDRTERDGASHFKEAMPLDLIEYYIEHGSGIRGRLYKIVSFFTGFEPFKFTRQKADGTWFNQAPNVSELKKKGA